MSVAGIPAWLMRRLGQDVVVEPYLGAGPYGDRYGPPVTVRALVDNRRRRVLSPQGTETTAEATLRMPLPVVCPVGSRITLPDGRIAYAITSARHDGRHLPVPSHLEVTTT